MTEDGRPETAACKPATANSRLCRVALPRLDIPSIAGNIRPMSTGSANSTNDYVEPLNQQQIRIYRHMTGEQRLRIGFEITDFVTRFALAGIRYRHPEASDAEARRLLRKSYRA